MLVIKYLAAALLLVSCVSSDNSTAVNDDDTCGLLPEEGPWSALLEDWVTAERVQQGRHGRIMALPPTQGYYVSDRIDLMPPPPPPHHHPHHMHHRGPYPMDGHHPPGPHHGPPTHGGPHHGGPPHGGPPHGGPPHGGPPHGGPPQAGQSQGSPSHGGPPELHNSRLQNQPGSSPPGPPPPGPPPPGPPPQESKLYDEWQATPPPSPGVGKIVNRPPNPYKDQFKPSFPPPTPNPIPVHGGGLSDRVDEARPPPHKQVSETDLYLLGAIEKLVYRVDLMEKRLRKMEENVHYLVAGSEAKPEPCPSNFTRIGDGCYHFSSEALNWKNANYACRKVKGYLLEFDADDEKRKFISGVLTDKKQKGHDFWTGGLNPGLLWIWSHSAKAVANNTAGGANDTASVVGEGRCLALAHDAPRATYSYRGHDCALRHRYVCERDDDKARLGNEIERVARKMREGKRKPKIMWTDDDFV